MIHKLLLILTLITLTSCSLISPKKDNIELSDQLTPINLIVRYGELDTVSPEQAGNIEYLKNKFIASDVFANIETSYYRYNITIKATIQKESNWVTDLTSLPNGLLNIFSLGIIPNWNKAEWGITYEIHNKDQVLAETTITTKYSTFTSWYNELPNVDRRNLNVNFDKFINQIKLDKTLPVYGEINQKISSF